jgi:hypothetical protein
LLSRRSVAFVRAQPRWLPPWRTLLLLW